MSLTVNPVHFLKRLLKLSVVAIVLILLGSVFGIHWVFQSYVIDNAESQAISISEVIVELERELIVHTDKNNREYLDIDPSEYSAIETTLENFLVPFQIHKIKVFDTDGKIIYSTDKNLVGLTDSNNVRLKRALNGLNDSKLESKDKIADLKEDEHFNVDIVESYVPIFDRNQQVIGSFEIYKDVTSYRDDIRIGVMLSSAILGGIFLFAFIVSYFLIRQSAMRLHLAQQKLHHMATVDSLTGLYSRSEIIDIMRNEFDRFVRLQNTPEQQPVGLIVLDIDHFKSINDNYGHPVGDIALKEIANCLKSNIRQKNAVGRFGGEEFLIILPQENLETSRLVAERIRTAIEGLQIEANGEQLKVTASLGVSEFMPGETEYHPAVKRADVALYEAKENGRNRVVIHQNE